MERASPIGGAGRVSERYPQSQIAQQHVEYSTGHETHTAQGGDSAMAEAATANDGSAPVKD